MKLMLAINLWMELTGLLFHPKFRNCLSTYIMYI